MVILMSSNSSLFSNMARFPIINMYVRIMWCVAAIVQNEAPIAASRCAPSDYAVDCLSQSTLHLHPLVRLMQSCGIFVLNSVVCHRAAFVMNDCQIVFCVESHHTHWLEPVNHPCYREGTPSPEDIIHLQYFSADAVINRTCPSFNRVS